MIPCRRQHGLDGVLQFLKSLPIPITKKLVLLTSYAIDSSGEDANRFAKEAIAQLKPLGFESIEIEAIESNDLIEGLIGAVMRRRGDFDIVLLEHHDYAEHGEISSGKLIEQIVLKIRVPVVVCPKVHHSTGQRTV